MIEVKSAADLAEAIGLVNGQAKTLIGAVSLLDPELQLIVVEMCVSPQVFSQKDGTKEIASRTRTLFTKVDLSSAFVLVSYYGEKFRERQLGEAVADRE